MSRARWKIALITLVAVPALIVRACGVPLSPLAAMAAFGGAIVAASFLLAWAAEVAQVDISASLATALLALIAVLPEYAVDLYFAFTAGHRPEYTAYAAANMTGSNRLLVGVGWPLAALLFAWRRPSREVLELVPRRRVELAFLGAAGVYAFVIPLKGTLSIVDAAVLLLLFVVYLWRTSQQPHEEPELAGVAATLAELPRGPRRATVVGLFGVAAVVIWLSAKPFAEALIEGGRHLGVDEFLLVQWLAPLASEAPELLVAAILALRGNGDAALGTLLSSKVNQWTLLVGSLPLAYAAGGGRFSMPLDARQTEEFVLTAAQAIFAVAVLLRLRLSPRAAGVLFVAFAAQLLSPRPEARLAFAAGYGALAIVLAFLRREDLGKTARALFSEPRDVVKRRDG